MSERKISVDTVDYGYVIGRSNASIRNLKTRKRVVVSLTDLTGMTVEKIDEAVRSRSFTVAPKQVADYIKGHAIA